MKTNIGVKLCNLEKIFPPSFFDIMEHLPVHLPTEAALGGPVQYRWMYPFERYMYHLKKKVRNKAHIGGSIVAQCITEEIAYASSNYFKDVSVPPVTDSAKDINFCYSYNDIPSIFYHEGRIGGKRGGGLLTDEDYNVLQTFLLLNCESFSPYERMFEEYMNSTIPNITPNDLQLAKDNHFASWCKEYINEASGEYTFPLWMLDFVQGPRRDYKSWPMYQTRGYQFHTLKRSQTKRTQNYGVCVRGTTNSEYYGKINDIMLIEYQGDVGLKAMVFKCEWFDANIGRGMRRHPSGLVDVSIHRHYAKYDPFILPSQCDQVCFIPYPRVRRVIGEEWWACTKVKPRVLQQATEVVLPPLQDDQYNQFVVESSILRIDTHAVHDESGFEIEQGDPPNDEYAVENELEDSMSETESDSTSE